MDTSARAELGRYIESLRKEKNKTLRPTAKAIGVSSQFLSEVEKGRRSALTNERLEKLAEFLCLL